MSKSSYDKIPSTIVEGNLFLGWVNILQTLRAKDISLLAVDLYLGVFEDEVMTAFSQLNPDLIINTRDLFKSEGEILTMTERFMTKDVLFGYVTNLSLKDYFDIKKLQAAQEKITKSRTTIVIGTGASLVVPNASTLVYVDMARWEIQQRFRKQGIKALGVDNRHEPVSLQYKRGYFNDWRICDKHKESLFSKIDYWLDTHVENSPKMIDRQTFFNGIEKTSAKPFRVVPFFDPAPWGGQWMKQTFDLDQSRDNYGWCFDCVPEENSLLLNVNGSLFEMPSTNLILIKSREVLGEAVEARFGKEFPIRFDFLDTMGGGNLSLQVHPTTQFIRDEFGMTYTQDESYYMMDAAEDGIVYLGLKHDIDNNAMMKDLRDAQAGRNPFDAEKYVNKFPARKHDHFLIPGGTIHCSGKNSVVLEISSTPSIFTFKLWDWQRLGLDGKPRPINVERGGKVIDWQRNTTYVQKYLANCVEQVSKSEGCVEEKTGLHRNEFIETRRHWFTTDVIHHTNNIVNVLNLVEGDEVTITSPDNAFEPFVVHYAETFIIPASIGQYIISPKTKGSKKYGTIKAFVRV